MQPDTPKAVEPEDGRAADRPAQFRYGAVFLLTLAVVVLVIAAPSACLSHEPPSLVELAQDAVRWLSRSIIELDQDAPDAAAAIVDGLGRILALHVFTQVARGPKSEPST